mgnify:CR=1 FL=1
MLTAEQLDELPEWGRYLDVDGDGIPDEDDACPDEPGAPEMDGCPDRDGDNVPDGEDACPDEKGLGNADPAKNA